MSSQLYKNQSYINTLPTYILETSYSPSQLTVFDYHGKKATCSATVAIYVRHHSLPIILPVSTHLCEKQIIIFLSVSVVK